MNDENYAINYLKFVTDKNWSAKDALLVEYYSLASWATGNLLGGLIGSAVQIDLVIVDFALTALFIYMIVMQVHQRLTLFIGILSAGLSIYFLTLVKSTLGIILATVLASFVGFIIENRVRHYPRIRITPGFWVSCLGRPQPITRWKTASTSKTRRGEGQGYQDRRPARFKRMMVNNDGMDEFN